MSVSIITPVYNSPELATQYAKAVRGAEVIIVDNASEPSAALVWEQTARDLDGTYLRNNTNRWYATACNQGYAVASGDIVMFCNNDIMARSDWLHLLGTIDAGALYGPGIGMRTLAGQPLLYIDAWWIAARKETWEAIKHSFWDGRYDIPGLPSHKVIGPWDGDAFQGMYWDDVDLCFRAARLGIALRTVSLPLAHLSNYTSSRTPGAYAHTDSNGGDGAHRAICEARVKAWQGANNATV